jgi:hypothetical protein
MVGSFWVVEADGQAAIIALAVPLEQAAVYGDMLTVDTGHLEYWSALGRRGARALREAGLPTAHEEWPRGRVLYDRVAQRFVIRADCQLQRPLRTRNRRRNGSFRRSLSKHPASSRHVIEMITTRRRSGRGLSSAVYGIRLYRS